jgi:hypothetical protein
VYLPHFHKAVEPRRCHWRAPTTRCAASGAARTAIS